MKKAVQFSSLRNSWSLAILSATWASPGQGGSREPWHFPSSISRWPGCRKPNAITPSSRIIPARWCPRKNVRSKQLRPKHHPVESENGAVQRPHALARPREIQGTGGRLRAGQEQQQNARQKQYPQGLSSPPAGTPSTSTIRAYCSEHSRHNILEARHRQPHRSDLARWERERIVNKTEVRIAPEYKYNQRECYRIETICPQRRPDAYSYRCVIFLKELGNCRSASRITIGLAPALRTASC